MGAKTLHGFPATGTTPGSQASSRLLRVITRCATRPEFLATFGRFVDETSIFVATHQPRACGVAMPFAIALEDGEAMLRGEAEVIESSVEADGPMKRPGMRLRILRLDGSSRETHAELLARKRAGSAPPPIPADAPPHAEPAERRASPSSSSTPAPETRVPGSSYIVPANPFGELKPEALESFVDCTLYEETMVQPEAAELPPPPFTPPRGAAALPVGDTAVMTPASVPRPPVGLTPLASSQRAPVSVDVELIRIPRSSLAPVLTAVIGVVVGLGGGFIMWGSRDEAPPPSRAAAPTFLSEPTGNPALVAAPPHPAAATALSATAPSAAALSATAPSAAAPSATAPSATAPSATAPSRAEVTTPPASAPAPAPTPPVLAALPAAVRPSAPPPSGCRATIVSEPPDAPVRIAGALAGRTPLDQVTVPCGDLLVSIEHPRYGRVERRLTVAEGNDARVEAHLVRPPGVLELRSAPPGATFTVNGAPVGRAPATASVPAFTFVSVKASLDGYGTWSQRVYVRGTRMSVTAPLEPGRRALKSTARPQL